MNRAAKGTAIAGLAVIAGLALTAAGCGSNGDESTKAARTIPQGSKPVPIDPAEFTTQIDNPYWPMTPGDHWVYREVENGDKQRVDVTVTNRTKMLANGVEARVVHDRVSQHGQTIENTFDWYAQDSDGNLWYMGEDTAEYENGKLKTRAGSWEAGADGAEPGYIMPADPQAGMSYREEYYEGEAEDEAKITGTDAKTNVPFGGTYTGVVTTENTSPLEPNVVEHKWYARGVGPVREAIVSGGRGSTVLIDFSHG